MSRLEEMGAFLKARRADIAPAEAGVPSAGLRRVAGLRREEVALLAGVSVDYYVRLEQGRAAHPSAQVLDAVARVLRLDDVERAHLEVLATPPARRRSRPRATVRPALAAMLGTITGSAAYVLDSSMTVLAGNRMAAALFGFDWRRPRHNVARAVFLDPAARSFWVEWPRVTRDCVGFLRLSQARDPTDPRLRTLVGELSVSSAEFARLWAQQRVKSKTYGDKAVDHPLVGRLALRYETLLPTGDGGQAMIVYTPGDESSADACRLLLHEAETGAHAEAPGRPRP